MKSRILLIDDSMTIHRVIDLCVDKDKYDVQKVFTKEEAVSALDASCPDLVLLDNKLTDAVASDMVAMIKDACPNCFVVLLAGAFDHFDKDQCTAAGADDYIFKPFDAKTLDSKILCGLEGVCHDETQPEKDEDISEDEMDSLMGGMNEEVEIPPFEEESDISEDISGDIFDGLKEADENMPAEEGMTEEAEAEQETFEPVSEEPEPEESAAEPQGEGSSGVLLEDFDFDSLVIPDDPETDAADPFDGLVEADELSVLDKPAVSEPLADIADAEPADELEDILDGITEETDAPEITETIEDVEEALAEDELELADMEQTEDAAQMALYEMDGEPKGGFEDLFAVDEDENRDEPAETGGSADIEIPDDVEMTDEIDDLIQETAHELMDEEAEAVFEEPESSADTETLTESEVLTESEPAAEMESEDELLPELGEEELKEEMPVISAAVPKVSISHEKLVEAVFEAIDEDTLKYAVKEVLTDKISRILEEELPILVERAIRKEIERLVKGNKGE